MQFSTTKAMLDIWDAQAGLDHTGRALLLARVGLGQRCDDPSALPIGERDRLLLDLRERLFGPRVEVLEQCPGCGVRLEIAFDIDAVRVTPLDRVDSFVTLEAGGYEISARLPTSCDLLELRGCRDVAEAHDRLLANCLVAASRDGAPVGPRDLPEAAQLALSRALGAADPQAEIELELDCSACGHGWRTHFDIVEYLTAEIEQFGRRTLRDVDLLAGAYGWSEGEILALPPRRRSYYLEQVFDG